MCAFTVQKGEAFKDVDKEEEPLRSLRVFKSSTELKYASLA
jgi:hypothetical protein